MKQEIDDMGVFRVVLSLFIVAVNVYTIDSCDTTAIQHCIGGAADLAAAIYLNPLDVDNLKTMKTQYCNTSTVHCLEDESSAMCSDTTLVPYRTIIDMLQYVCSADINTEDSCWRNEDFTLGIRNCFDTYQDKLNRIVQDPLLTKPAVYRGLCRAFDDVTVCAWKTAGSTCDINMESLVLNLLHRSMRANSKVMGCYNA